MSSPKQTELYWPNFVTDLASWVDCKERSCA
jgi:hypothetical protein